MAKFNAEHIFQLHCFWPATGRLNALPIQLKTIYLNPPARGDASGKTALILGEPFGQKVPGPGLPHDRSFVRIHAAAEFAGTGWCNRRYLASPRRQVPDRPDPLRGHHEDRMVSPPPDPVQDELITTTTAMWYPETGLGEGVYGGVVDRPADLVRFAPDGTKFPKRVVGRDRMRSRARRTSCHAMASPETYPGKRSPAPPTRVGPE